MIVYQGREEGGSIGLRFLTLMNILFLRSIDTFQDFWKITVLKGPSELIGGILVRVTIVITNQYLY